jgi:hypothetical protein
MTASEASLTRRNAPLQPSDELRMLRPWTGLDVQPFERRYDALALGLVLAHRSRASSAGRRDAMSGVALELGNCCRPLAESCRCGEIAQRLQQVNAELRGKRDRYDAEREAHHRRAAFTVIQGGRGDG